MSARKKLRSAMSGVLLAGIVTFSAGQASAMPTLDRELATTRATQVEQVRWVCGPWRCFWRPNYWGFYRPWRPWGIYRPWWRPWGFYRPWRPWGYGFYRPWRRWGWGWHRHW
jgi:hypothetical protein